MFAQSRKLNIVDDTMICIVVLIYICIYFQSLFWPIISSSEKDYTSTDMTLPFVQEQLLALKNNDNNNRSKLDGGWGWPY
jgi:hypothetical protein